MTRWLHAVLIVISVAALPVVMHGQDATPTTGERYRADVDLVALDVCVKDRQGHFVPTLRSSDLVVLEDNVPQPISFVWAADRVPVAVTLLIDRSSSMEGDPIRYAKEAAMRFVDGLGSDDQLSIIAFGRRTQRLAAFSDDRERAADMLLAMDTSGTTSLYDAVMVALDGVQTARRHRVKEMRDVVLMLTDGDDTSSVNTFDEVKAAARRSDVLVYSVAIRLGRQPIQGFTRNLAPPWPLIELATDSGGEALAAPAIEQLPAVFDGILTEISHLYRVGYVSTNTKRDGTWRKVSVRVPGKDVTARTRTGYTAPRDPM